MSNEEGFLNICKNLSEECSVKDDIINRIIEELCDLHKEEEEKGNYATTILNLIENYLANKQLKPEDIIN
ncbi:8123_t:CDS:2, partial [Scutellospora calospora]